jgi:hypothetical protein
LVAHTLVKLVGHVDRFLPGHGVGDQEDFFGTVTFYDLFQLAHHAVVDLQAARGVEKDDAVRTFAGTLKRARTDVGRRGLYSLAVHSDVDLAAQDFELLHRRRAVRIGSDHERPLSRLAQAQGQLGGHRRLAGPLQADQHDHVRRRAGQVQRRGIAQGVDQFFVDDLDHLLGGRQAAHDLGADGAFFDALDKGTDHFIVDVGL